VLIVVIASSTKVMPASFLPWQPFQPTKMHLGCPYTLWVLLCRLWTYNRHLVQNPSFHYMSKMCINMGPKCVWAQPWIRPRTQIREKRSKQYFCTTFAITTMYTYYVGANFAHVQCSNICFVMMGQSKWLLIYIFYFKFKFCFNPHFHHTELTVDLNNSLEGWWLMRQQGKVLLHTY
jgi:hypothetical protein